jgi:signal transduction histidine kinase
MSDGSDVSNVVSQSAALNSQQALAASLARDVQRGLPQTGSAEGIAALVEEALRKEAINNERTLAYMRVIAVGMYALFSLAAFIRPELFGIPNYPLYALLFALGWAFLAVVVALALRAGWYRPWLRLIMPASDGLFLGLSVIVGYGVYWRAGPMPPGITAILATACAFLSFSGALRLSRAAIRLTTILAIFVWGLGYILNKPTRIDGWFIVTLLIATGFIATRATQIIRRVIVNEVSRGRLTSMYEDVQEAVVAREEVLKIVSHDLRNPLNTVSMAADLLLETAGLPDTHSKHLRVIQRATERMNRMIQDLLDVARLEAGTLHIQPQRVAVSKLFADVLEMMRPIAESQGQTMDTVADEALPAVHVDSERTIQVFSNLIGNAVKFTPVGGLIVLKAERMGDKVRFAVVDSGPGIPPEQLPDIFGKFWQAQKSDRRGIGLGLTIARSIVEAHGERIGVESRLGEGTEFWFTAQVAQQPATQTQPS